jgi:spore coat polysaccharide biosynthesis predicted glycosyltransferase SpsG
VAPAVEAILVATGGGDPTGRAGDTAQAIAEASPGARTMLVTGPYAAAADEAGGSVLTVRAPDSLHDLLAATDLAVITAGQTMLEALALGTPAVAVPAAENQRSGAESLAELGAIVTAEGADPSAIGEVARELAGDSDRRRALSARAQETIDGGGAIRVARRLLELNR